MIVTLSPSPVAVVCEALAKSFLLLTQGFFIYTFHLIVHMRVDFAT